MSDMEGKVIRVEAHPAPYQNLELTRTCCPLESSSMKKSYIFGFAFVALVLAGAFGIACQQTGTTSAKRPTSQTTASTGHTPKRGTTPDIAFNETSNDLDVTDSTSALSDIDERTKGGDRGNLTGRKK
jgi:hypothetical protein